MKDKKQLQSFAFHSAFVWGVRPVAAIVLYPLTLEDKPRFDAYARRTVRGAGKAKSLLLNPEPRLLSAYAFAPIWIWRAHFQFHWSMIHDHLCVFAQQGVDYFMPLIPMGDGLSPAVIQTAFDFMLDHNRAKQIARIENVPDDAVPIFRDLGCYITQKETEYIYDTATLVQLRGNRFKSKRAAYNAFARQYPEARLMPYALEYLAECLALYETWAQERLSNSTEIDRIDKMNKMGNNTPINPVQKDSVYCAMIEDAQSAHTIGLAHAADLGLVGRVVFVDGKLKGYTFGYPLRDDTFCVLFEITDLRIKGLAQFIFREFCRELSAYRWISAMDDSGLENLRRVKLSYRPMKQIRSYIAHR